MIRSCILFFIVIALSSCFSDQVKEDYVIVIHGGAGNVSPEYIREELQNQYIDALGMALDRGKQVLENGGSGIDAVEQVIRVMEDSPLFNAGKGAVFTHEGKNEMDASIMDGLTLNAGAVASVGDIKNPISAARMVMDNSEHVMLFGGGASRFAREQGLEIVDSSYFYTERRWKSLQRILERDSVEKYSTVGCVVMDTEGNLAAGTSTGGMTNKKFGRVGDSPIIGAGTYANNRTCAISATGHGEYFIRYTVAHDISTLMEYKGLSLEKAAHTVIHEKLNPLDGKGGVIGIDSKGNIVMEFNTTGMFRGYVTASGKKEIALFGKEDEQPIRQRQ